ncbi:ABC transporter substrate-binding protein [Shewanella sp. UCD-KL12]|uniref:substrate-binding periplasmic protein n=1 Tax=Shewanella sp. UCD-KL12 TaxID=1917163 RepID=UPI0009713A32|nr:transporter substrate-binding domain-containing protein [Shewanella sp. UCD-KL12]
MLKLFLCLFLLTFTCISSAQEKLLTADIRHRPPQMIIDQNDSFGPLKDILNEAASEIGYKIKWRIAPFARSLKDLQNGKIDIVPRVIKTEQREKFIDYLGPIGLQQKDILFLVRKGFENRVNSYNDLYKYEIGVKRNTAYFKAFNNDLKLNKVLLLDDKNMSSMFAANRFDIMIVLDKTSIEQAFKQIGFTDYAYANYRHKQNVGIYYGFSKFSADIKVKAALEKALLDMTQSGRIEKIYQQHNALPPTQKL